MYNSLNEEMFNAGETIKHNQEVWLDVNDEITNNLINAFRRKAQYQLISSLVELLDKDTKRLAFKW
jgi:hypothetical protein